MHKRNSSKVSFNQNNKDVYSVVDINNEIQVDLKKDDIRTTSKFGEVHKQVSAGQSADTRITADFNQRPSDNIRFTFNEGVPNEHGMSSNINDRSINQVMDRKSHSETFDDLSRASK